MVFFNYATMQMAAKIVYYGPGLCGKTTNLHHIYAKTSPQSRGEMVSLETETDRTLFFDLLPIDVGVIGGFKTRLQLYTVPGQVFYNTTRKLVLKGVDGIVFVADSQRAAFDGNLESFKNLRENLQEIGLDADELPLVIQLNKRDLPNIVAAEEMIAALDPQGKFGHVESVASSGIGVFDTLKLISKLTLRTLRRRMTGDERSSPPPARIAALRVQADELAARTAAARAAAQGPRTAPDAVQSPPGAPPPPTAPATSEVPVHQPPAATTEEFFDADATVAAAATEQRATLSLETADGPASRQSIEPLAEPFEESTTSFDAVPFENLLPPAEESSGAGPQDTADSELTFGAEFESITEPPPKAMKPEVKTVKVRSSIDVMAELEALRKRATQTPPRAPKRDIIADLEHLRPRRDLHRNAQLEIPADVLPRVRTVRVTLVFEDGDEGIITTREQKVELGDTSDVQSLSVNLKIDLA
jgi:signal recognition particle receptor subunit beta